MGCRVGGDYRFENCEALRDRREAEKEEEKAEEGSS